jgi:hypothetical protein
MKDNLIGAQRHDTFACQALPFGFDGAQCRLPWQDLFPARRSLPYQNTACFSKRSEYLHAIYSAGQLIGQHGFYGEAFLRP